MQIIDKNITDEIIRKVDLVEIIGADLKLKRSGNNYFACCPFHKEKSPSFSINSKDQYFHCFGCGESGDAITYVMKTKGLDFIEAVKTLADKYGIYIPQSNANISIDEIKKQKAISISLNTIMNTAVNFYLNNLKHSNLGINYLKNRGLTQEIIDKFNIGFAPNNPSLSTLFDNYDSNQQLIDAGLVVKNDTGKHYDRFRDRIMFPIKNTKGNVIGFGGRIIAKGEPKYLNSPETTLFNKSLELYGLYEAQKAIRELNYVIVVEGYMDVIALSQSKVDNAVATMGTAVSEDHIKKLFRLSDDIYYCFDGDLAGQKAAWRALERSLPLVTDTKTAHFLFLPEEHDPDSYIRQYGKDEFIKKTHHQSLSLTGFLLNKLASNVNLSREDGRAKLISLAKPYIEKVKATALNVMIKQQLAKIVELAPDVLESILNNKSRFAFYNSKWNKNVLVKENTTIIPINTVEIIIKNAILHVDWVCDYLLPDNIEIFSRETQEMILILDFIANNYTSNDKVDILDLKNNIEFSAIDLDKVVVRDTLNLTQNEFKTTLDKVFGFTKPKAIKIPRIPLNKSE